MINKKIHILLSCVVGITLSFGTIQIPVLAVDNVQATSSDTSNLAESQNYLVSKNNSIEKNGLKISIDKVLATKHKLEATLKIENQNAFDETAANNIETLLSYGDNEENGSGLSIENPDEKTILLKLDREVTDSELPEKGELRIDVVIPKYKINVGIDANVDFSEAFKNSMEKDLSVKIPEFNFTIKKLDSNILGTEITYSKQIKDNSLLDDEMSNLHASKLILQIGDKMYPITGGGSSSSEKDKVINGTYNADSATYDKVKGQDKISLIPIICTMTNDERSTFYKNNKNHNKDESTKETLNNISYTKDFNFSDGTKGQVYNIERDDNNVLIYCKGATETESLLMASSASIFSKFDDNQTVYYNYNSRKNMTFYKDPKDALGYIVKFSNLKKDKVMNLNFNNLISQIDKYNLGNEVKLMQ